MTENPFGEGFDIGAMMEQAQALQAQMIQAQEELAATSLTSSAGGVTVTVTGVGELTAVAVAPGTFDGSDEESLADLGDLVLAAYRDAKSQADALASEALGPLAGGLGGDEPGPALGGPVV